MNFGFFYNGTKRGAEVLISEVEIYLNKGCVTPWPCHLH
jgi:hypothetical protein